MRGFVTHGPNASGDVVGQRAEALVPDSVSTSPAVQQPRPSGVNAGGSPALVVPEEIALVDVVQLRRLSDSSDVHLIGAVQLESARVTAQAARDEREIGVGAEEDTLVVVPILVELHPH